jgi:hypothetical protein
VIVNDLCCHEDFYVLLGRILTRATTNSPKKRSSVQTQRPWIIESTDEHPGCDLKIGEISRGSPEHSGIATHAAEYSADLGSRGSISN